MSGTTGPHRCQAGWRERLFFAAQVGRPAAALDIQPGDRIFIVDGQPAEKLSSAEVRRLLDERRELVLVLRRGDQQVEVRVPVIDLVP